MTYTSAGYVGIVNDKPTDIITGRVYGATSGGWWMIPGSIAGATSVSLSGGVVTFDNNVINVTPGGSGLNARPIGMALMNCASGTKNFVALIRKGDVIVPANGNATTGYNAAAAYVSAGEGCVANANTGSMSGQDIIGMFIGQSCTSGTNAFQLLHLNL